MIKEFKLLVAMVDRTWEVQTLQIPSGLTDTESLRAAVLVYYAQYPNADVWRFFAVE